MRLALAFLLAFTMAGILTQAGCIPKAYPAEARVERPAQYVPVPTAPKHEVKKQTWKDTAKQIGRSGVFMIGVNAIVWGFRFGMAAFGLPVF